MRNPFIINVRPFCHSGVVEHRDRLARFGVEHLEAATKREPGAAW
jgi:predicted site-specific integrase-resolvase